MRIYFAGPLFTTAERDFNTALGALLRAGGHEVFLPRDQELDAYNPAKIFRNDVDHVDWSNVVVGIMDGRTRTAARRGRSATPTRWGRRSSCCAPTSGNGAAGGDAPYNLMLTESATEHIDCTPTRAAGHRAR